MSIANRRTMAKGVLASAVMILTGCGEDTALDGLPGGREGRVTEVLSGDVLVLDHRETVRLIGAYAPTGDHAYAETAASVLRRLAYGRTVQLFFGGERQDDQGRTLAHARDAASRRWLQGALLTAGAARARTYVDNHALAPELLRCEAQARRAGRGLWRLTEYRVRLPREVAWEDRAFTLVEGRVARVGEGRGGDRFIDFSRDWRGALSLEVSHAADRTLRTADLDVSDLEGRLIRVRGMVEALRLRVDHPEQIERLTG